MGYDLHITRADDWSTPDGSEIESSEWIKMVETDPELATDAVGGDFAVIWSDATGAQCGWFDWYDGSVFTTNPDKAAVGKLLQMAARLEARVQGDDGEFYESEEQWEVR